MVGLRPRGPRLLLACGWLVAILVAPTSAGTSLSIWLDTWFIKDNLQVVRPGPFELTLNVTAENYHVSYRDNTRHLVVDHIPVPSDDYILHLGIVTGPGPDDIQLYAAERKFAAQRGNRPLGLPGAARTAPLISQACGSLAVTPHYSFHHKVIFVCETKEETLDEHAMRTWAQHQRDNTIGLEQRLFVVDGNGKDVLQKGRHVTLSYSFTVRSWYAFKAFEEPQPLFWQGTFVLAMLYYQDATHHLFKVFISDSMDIWISESVPNPPVGKRMQFGISRDISKGTVRLFENGRLLKETRDSNSADTILQSFDIVTEELRRDLVFALSCSDQPSSASDMWDNYKRTKVQMRAMDIAPMVQAKPAAEEPKAPEKEEKAPAEEAEEAVEEQDSEAQEDAEKPQPPPKESVSSNPFQVHVNWQKRDPAVVQVPGGSFTVELSVSLRHASSDRSLLLLDGRHLRLWMRYQNGRCQYMLAFNRQKWVSTGVAASGTGEDPIHVAVVNDVGQQQPRMYHQNMELQLSPQDRSGNTWLADTTTPGPVLWYDVLQTPLPLHDFRHLALRKPLPDDDDVYWGLLWLLGFLTFGMGCGGLLVLVGLDPNKAAKAEKVV